MRTCTRCDIGQLWESLAAATMTDRTAIQIWSPSGDGWVRPPVGPHGDHYSAVRTLQPRRSSRSRLLLIGESVATGYLYAPWYTPAGVLAELLPTWDVIDLARTNESLETLLVTLDEGIQLEPDAVVMWAGNNWWLRDLGSLSPYHPRSTHRVALGEVLRREGLAGAEAFAEAELRRFVLPRLERLATRVREAATRLIVIVPEVNLVDWQSCQPTPVLPTGAESEWHGALANLDATCMGALDGLATSTTRRLAASTEAAGPSQLDGYRNEVGAAAGPLRAVTTSPMASRAIQHVLREWVDDHGFESVDVPALIGSVAGDGPDRTWFLDYCHHTALGIEAVVAAIADVVGTATHIEAARPAAELCAVAALGALMHTDHRLVSSTDRRPLLQHWKTVAEDAFEGAHDLIRDLVESRIGSSALPLTEAQRRNQARPFPFGFAHGWRPSHLELDALSVLGMSNTEAAALILPAERAWPSTGTIRPGQTLWTDDEPGSTNRGFLRAVWPTTEFGLQLDGRAMVEVRLTCRVSAAGEIRIALGGWSTIASVATTWTSVRLSIPADAAAPGLRALQISWPRLEPGTQRWSQLLAALADDRPGELHPIFGEVHSLIVGPRG